MKLLLKLSYAGTAYNGFQVQPDKVTVQSKIQDAVEKVYGSRYPVTGCGRTDRGVHANEYYCTVELDENANKVPIDKVYSALNRFLPYDISIFNAVTVDVTFHPRYNVISKEYIYLIWNDEFRNPFMHGRAYHFPKFLDTELMNQAAKHFIGNHDFKGFVARGSKIKDTVREIFNFNVKRDGPLITVSVSADGFLYNMVRILTGTLIFVSEGRIKLCEIDDIIKNGKRSEAGMTVPPDGLYLNRVVYDYGKKTVHLED